MRTICIMLLLALCSTAFGMEFYRITDSDLVNNIGNTGGICWGDYDNDGDEDVFVAQYMGNSMLFRNDGNFCFTPVLADPTFFSGRSMACTWGDYDHDGWLDLLVSSDSNYPTQLLHNLGNGHFERDSLSIVNQSIGYNYGASWGDANEDGYLDIFLSNLNPGPSHFFMYSPDSSYVQVSGDPLSCEIRRTVFTEWIDYDHDGDKDCILLNAYGGTSYIYQNDGQGNFTREYNTFITPISGYSSFNYVDFNNDGILDYYFSSPGVGCLNQMYISGETADDGTWMQNSPIVDSVTSSRSSAWGDLDNDGDLDLVVVGGVYNEPSDVFVYENQGGNFVRHSGDELGDLRVTAIGVTLNDCNNDGFLDVLIGTGNEYYGSYENDYLFGNAGNYNHWLKVKLEGTESNSAGIGAIVRVCTDIDGMNNWQTRAVLSQTGYDCQNGLVQHFGLGEAKQVMQLVVDWPDGQHQVINNIPCDQLVIVTQPDQDSGFGTTDAQDNNATAAKVQLANYPNPFNPSTQIKYNLPKAQDADLRIYNIRGQLVKSYAVGQQEQGEHTILWNGCDNQGQAVASGVYFIRLQAGPYRETHRAVLMK